MLQTEDLGYQYPGAPPLSFPDISCPAGEHRLILGASGCGKTTLLHLLAGLLRTQRGRIRIGGTALQGLNGTQLDRFRGQHIGVIFQKAHFVAALSLQDNLRLARYLAGLKPAAQRIAELLERLRLSHRAAGFPHQLSEGEKQRAAIARAVLNAPSLLLADEPTASLDDGNATEVAQLLAEMTQPTGGASPSALVIVTHDQRLKDHFADHLHLQPAS